jgi:hypothetical protein
MDYLSSINFEFNLSLNLVMIDLVIIYEFLTLYDVNSLQSIETIFLSSITAHVHYQIKVHLIQIHFLVILSDKIFRIFRPILLIQNFRHLIVQSFQLYPIWYIYPINEHQQQSTLFEVLFSIYINYTSYFTI